MSGLGDLQSEAISWAQAHVFHQAHNAFINGLLATPGLNDAQRSYLNTMLGYSHDYAPPTYPADIWANALAATSMDSPSPSMSPVYRDGHVDTLGAVIAEDQTALLNVVKAYAGTTGQTLFNQQQANNAAYDTSEQAIAAAGAAAAAGGTPYYIAGTPPPAQYQPQNLPTEPVYTPPVIVAPSNTGAQAAANAGASSNPVLNLTPGHTTTTPALPNLVGAANGTAPIPSGGGSNTTPPATDFMAELQTTYAGIPLWGWLAGAAVGAVVLTQMGHKK